MRTTLGEARSDDNGIPLVLNLCSTDDRVRGYINQAQRRLITRGKFWGTYGRFRVCVCSGCLVWPRQFASIESMAICNSPAKLRNEWFEFLEEGCGLRHSSGGGCAVGFDHGTAVSFEDMPCCGSDKIKVYADATEVSTARILLLGSDQNGIPIRTLDAGSWIDGEYVRIDAATPQISVNYFSSLTGVIKPVTNKSVRLYRYSPATGNELAMAIYEWDEERPSYRRTLIPGLSNDSCGRHSVTVMAKLEFIPARNDNDFLLIGNIPALKDMCQSIKKREDNLFAEAEAYEASAIRELEEELGHYLGTGTIQPVNFESRHTWGGGVCNVV